MDRRTVVATAVDSGDYVAVVGGAYTFSISNLTMWWLGLPIGWFLVSHLVLLPLYRTGMFTNAEYLEYRFGPAARVLSVMIQLQYRTHVLGNIAFSLYLTFSLLTEWGSSTWWLVVSIALAAALYTAAGGLKSVAVTDAAQSLVMLAASMLLWFVVWQHVGGWDGTQDRLLEIDPTLVDSLLHVGGQNTAGVPAPLMVFGWIVVLSAYSVVNHSQAMRMLASRSEWDLKMAALAASAVTALAMWFNITLGIFGRSLMPKLAMVDEIYPRLIQQYLGPGLIGLVVAGVLAGGISTYDSVSSALAAVFTRDIYARFLVREQKDRHFLRVSRLVTLLVVGLSFLYIPFLGVGMVAFYLRLTSVAVIPLFTVYLMGTLTRVHRSSGTVGLVVGILYGLSSFLGDQYQWPLPFWWINQWWAYLWSMLVTSGAMLTVTAFLGWENRGKIQLLIYSSRTHQDTINAPLDLHAPTSGTWLEATQQEVLALQRKTPVSRSDRPTWCLNPLVWFGLFLALIAYTNLVILW